MTMYWEKHFGAEEYWDELNGMLVGLVIKERDNSFSPKLGRTYFSWYLVDDPDTRGETALLSEAKKQLQKAYKETVL